MKKRIRIRYIEKIVVLPCGTKLPRRKERMEVSSSVKRFFNCAHKLSKLSPSARMLLDFLTEQMYEDNSLPGYSYMKQQFQNHMKRSCNLTISQNSVKKWFKELKDHTLVIHFGRRGFYLVNPRHFYKGSEKQRKKFLSEVFSDACTNPYKKSNVKKALGL